MIPPKTLTEKAWHVRHTHKYHDICVGYLRYEALRKLNIMEFAAIYTRSLAGENFDAMVDELVVGGEK